jgi:nitrite reductase/ring-hydroxylating ferredoxin subunit
VHDGLTRRGLLAASGIALLSGCGGIPKNPRPKTRFDAGPLAGIRDDAWIERTYTLIPEAGEVGRLTVHVRKDRGTGRVRGLHHHCGCRPAEGRCPVRWTEGARRFICPCHGGVYDGDGKVDGGAERDLEPRRIVVEDGRIYVDLSR